MTAVSGILITVIFVCVQVIYTRALSFSACNTEKTGCGCGGSAKCTKVHKVSLP